METLNNWWKGLLEYSTILGALLVFSICGILLIFIVGILVILTKIWMFIK